MKRIIILLTFLLALWVGSINGEWKKAYFPSKPSAGPVVDIYFTDTLNGWAVGFNRWIAKTSDGGKSWTILPYPPIPPVHFLGIYTEENKVWVVGSSVYFPGSGIILYSSDNGETWEEHLNPDSNNTLFRVRRVGNKIWIVGGTNEPYWLGLLLESSDDSGASGIWIKHNLAKYGGFANIQVIDSTIWLSGSNGTIIKTTNYGNTWINSSVPDTDRGFGTILFQNNELYVIGSSCDFINKFYASTNNGQSWSVRKSWQDSVLLRSLGFSNSKIYAAGYVTPGFGVILQSSNHGFNWSVAWKDTGYGNLSSHLFQLDSTHMWVADPRYCLYYVPDPPPPVPLAPNLAWPPLGTQGLPAQITLKWHKVEGANSYRCQLSVDSGFTGPSSSPYDSLLSDTVMTVYVDSGEYYWRVYARNESGYGLASEIWHFSSIGPLGVSEITVPQEFTLSQNYPNPFNPVTYISYSIPNSDYITVKVYDLLGVEVATLVQGEKLGGSFSVPFYDQGLPSGIYYYRLVASRHKTVLLKKMVLLK